MAALSPMSLPIEVLETGLLRLPTVERARLLDSLVASLDADQARDRAPKIVYLWSERITRREPGKADVL